MPLSDAIRALSAFEPPAALPPADLALLAEVLEANGLAPIASYHLETCALGAGRPRPVPGEAARPLPGRGERQRLPGHDAAGRAQGEPGPGGGARGPGRRRLALPAPGLPPARRPPPRRPGRGRGPLRRGGQGRRLPRRGGGRGRPRRGLRGRPGALHHPGGALAGGSARRRALRPRPRRCPPSGPRSGAPPRRTCCSPRWPSRPSRGSTRRSSPSWTCGSSSASTRPSIHGT